MGIHESGVNYRNLIRNLADMYSQDVAEVVLIELIANSLDAKASRVEISFEPDEKILVIKDDGKGMSESDFEQYHDFAASHKMRGAGIGFAGVGAKISFNIAQRVITETNGKSFSGGSDWYFKTKKKLIWEDIKPKHVRTHGTRVEVRFQQDTKLPFSCSSDLISLITRSYLPLLDIDFLDLYEKMHCYPKTFRFIVNGKTIKPFRFESTFKLNKTKVFFPKKRGKRIGYGILGLAPSEYPLGQDISGVLLCTMGKTIKPELFNQFPTGLGPRIFGVVEVPEFVEFLTTSKTDFIRRGKHRQLEGLYGPIRQEFKAWLAELGIQQTTLGDVDEATKLERELRKLLDDVPELSEFFGFRTPKSSLVPSSLGVVPASPHSGIQATLPLGTGTKGSGIGPTDEGEENGTSLIEDRRAATEKAQPISRTTKRGPTISFSKSPKRTELAWVEGNAVVINSGHPCYIKAKSNVFGKKLHNIYAIAITIQRFLGDSDDNPDYMFIDKMMSAWARK